MSDNEAHARIKINKLLNESGWRFLDDVNGTTNIQLENHTLITEEVLNEIGENFEKTKNGFLDYLLLDDKGFPFIVLEAKREDIHPLAGKEQARTYAHSKNCRFIILSNGNLHYFWDLQSGNPSVIGKFPTLEEVKPRVEFKSNPNNLVNEIVNKDYIALTQKPDYESDPRWIDKSQRSEFIEDTGLRYLRKYQLRAVHRIQEEVANGNDRFLFEMATGTGKTLTAAAVIKLFLKTGNARRVLFLVDRLELEDQADKAFKAYLKNDYKCVIYKEARRSWKHAEIVVSTVQSFTKNNKYKRLFTPNDFDLIISDEAHRSISGNSRAVFEYFIGYKLGLTATPKDYLKKVDSTKMSLDDPRELERRTLLDTYITFGCESGEPTFRYSLIDGVNQGFLVNPIVSDARTDVTTQLLSEKGYTIEISDDETEEEEIDEVTDSEEAEKKTYFRRDFEKKFFSENTNKVFCQTFLENALRDPVTKEIGKSIVFCVSQHHAAKITQILNEFADIAFPGEYNSDFAVQVTSWITSAQQFTINFANNNLNGAGNFNPNYRTSKTRVCVTVGMMTTGYDCPDLLNVCLMRPIFSPTDFVQIKGRGTRKHNFLRQLRDNELAETIENPQKQNFKLFDFFANCEYFEEDFDYDEILKLPALTSSTETEDGDTGGGGGVLIEGFENFNPDSLRSLNDEVIGTEGMRVDRMLFDRFEEDVKEDAEVQAMVERRDFDAIERYIIENLFEKPDEFYNLEKLRKSLKIDRRLSLNEIIKKIFGFIPYFKGKDELLEDEFEKFDSRYLPDEKHFSTAKNYFKSYLTDEEFRDIIESKQFARLATNPNGAVFRMLPPELRALIPEYIKDNVSLNKFME
jgi:type I restriction enzyme R subunit